MTLKTTATTPGAGVAISPGQLLNLKVDLGIDQMNNTADAAKPVSTAQAAANSAISAAAASDATAKANTAQAAAISAGAADATAKANAAQSNAIATSSADATTKANAAQAAAIAASATDATTKANAAQAAAIAASAADATAKDTAERTSAATLTNKIIDGAANTLTNIPQSAMPTLATALSFKSDFLTRRSEAGSFAITAANHANRITVTTSATPFTFTFNTGHGLQDGDSGTILQVGAGTCTYTAGTASVVLGPAVSAAATTAQGSYIDWVFESGLLYFVARGTVPAAGGGGATQAFTNAVAFTALAASQTAQPMGTIKVAGQALTAKGQAYLRFKLHRTGTANPSFFVHINGTLIGTFSLTGDGGFANFPGGQLMLRGNGTDQTTILSGNSDVWDFADRTTSENAAVTVNTANDWVVTLSGTTPASCTLAILSAVVETITPQALA